MNSRHSENVSVSMQTNTRQVSKDSFMFNMNCPGDLLAFTLSQPPRASSSRCVIEQSVMAALSPEDDDKSDCSASTMHRSRSIPINGGSGMKRTPSELKLREEEEVADFRDYMMFCRIVEGISRSQQETRDLHSRQVNDMCLAHIIGTRNASEEDMKRDLYNNSKDYNKLSYLPPTSLQSFVGHTIQHNYNSTNYYNNNKNATLEEGLEEEVFSMDL